MNFLRDFNTFELYAILGFGGLYALYVLRLIVISRKTNANILKVLIKLVIRSAYVALIIIAFLGPYSERPGKKSQAKIVGKDIFIALDLSLSMWATDVAPNRINRVKNEITKLIREYSSDNIGLILFSTQAVLYSELTFDQANLIDDLNAVGPNQVPNTGTDLFAPLKLALDKHLKNDKTKNNAKVIILISDGEDFGEETIDIAEDIKSEGIKLFTLGVGTQQGSKIPLIKRAGYKKDKDGKEVISTLNDRSLKELAQITGGQYFEISKNRNDIFRLINAVGSIKGQFLDKREINSPKQLNYQWFVIIALALMTFDLLISIRIIEI